MVSSTGEGAPPPEVSMEPPTRAFAHYSGTLARASSIAHWQLRDLVCCVSNPVASNSSSSSASTSASSSSLLRGDDVYDPQLFVVRHCSTLRYSLRDRKSSVAQALPFAPTSMTAGHGYVAAGGQHGQLDVRRLSDGAVVLRGAAGGSVNNALALAPSPASSSSPTGGGGSGDGGVTLFVCNNDCSIKAYALPPVPSRGDDAPRRSASGGGRRRRGVRGGGGGGGTRSIGGENDENEMMTLDDDGENDCDDDDDLSDQEGEENVPAAAANDHVVAAAFEDHHYDYLEQQREEQEQQRRMRRQQQQQQQANNAGNRDSNVEAGRETLMASLEARVAAAVAAAVGASAATISNGNNGAGDHALRPTSASIDNVAAGRGNSTTLLRRRANGAATSSSARAARLAASSPAAVVRCLDPVNYCAPSPPSARGVPGYSSNSIGNGSSGNGTTTISPATLAAVGDCPSLSLHAPTESGYSPLASWDLFDDAGMACAWSASGTFVAAAAQCGAVVCVDPRVGHRAVMRRNVLDSSSSSSSSSSSVVARWRTPGGGAARALKASPAGSATDLLLVTEHDTFAHLVDARRFDQAQTLEIGLGRGNSGSEDSSRNSGGSDRDGGGGGSSLFSRGGGLFYGGIGGGSGSHLSSSGPTANGGHHLSGAAFSPEGDLAFVGAEDGGVAVFDVRTAERCCVGEYGYR